MIDFDTLTLFTTVLLPNVWLTLAFPALLSVLIFDFIRNEI